MTAAPRQAFDLDLRKLHYFVVTAEELHFGRAARRLQIAQPVLSRQIAALEGRLGIALFIRSRQGTQLSHAGRLILADARILLQHASAFERRATTLARR